MKDAGSTDTRDLANRAGQGLRAIRWLLAGIILAHGAARFFADGVTPFGQWLDGQGVPFGPAVAWGVTVFEIAGAPLLATGWQAFYLCIAYALVYLAGLVMVHAPAGWFVVGLGRNGMEYSVLLITCLLAVAWQLLPERVSGLLRRDRA
jgi:putative oxidoreductase